jgi:ferric-dicitrate binding protein FerR (iron transport regulator)
MGMSQVEHLQAALGLASASFPLDTADFADTDIKCAAAWMADNVENLHSRRHDLWQPVAALAVRLRPVSEALCRLQAPTVRAVAGTLNVAFVAALVILLAWPDVSLPTRYIEGFSQVGLLENSHTHTLCETCTVLQAASHLRRSGT